MRHHIFHQGRLLIPIVLLVCASMIATAAPQNKYTPITPPQQLTLPTHFDLRNVNGTDYVSGVRDQGPYGTCWTHGIMASMEGNLLMTGTWTAAGEEGEPNLAEAHLDWWNGFNDHNNDDDPGGQGIPVHEGGDYRVGTAYLTRGEGAVREIDAPYYNLDTPCARTDPSYHYYIPHDVEWYIAGTDLSNINTIKMSIMQHGVIGTAIYYDWNYMDYADYTFYQPPTDPNPPNHAVAIVGWDDTKVTLAPQPGAWIAKNSWGSGWGLDGFFWISYYDKTSCQDPQMGAVSYQGVYRLKDNKIYSYDYHGWRDTMPGVTEAFNAFTASSADYLHSICFYTAADNVQYTAKVYGTFSGGQLQNELVSTSGTIAHTGYHTIDLPSQVTLSPGATFYLYVSISNGGFPYDRTSDVPVLLGGSSRTIVKSIAHLGESYYKSGDEWVDLYTHAFTDPSWDGTANFCIKGITGPRKAPELKIMSISSGNGFNVVVKNVGDALANNTVLTANASGGLFVRVLTPTNTMGSIGINQSKSCTVKLFGIGLGFVLALPHITLNVTADDAGQMSRAFNFRILFTHVTSA